MPHTQVYMNDELYLKFKQLSTKRQKEMKDMFVNSIKVETEE